MEERRRGKSLTLTTFQTLEDTVNCEEDKKVKRHKLLLLKILFYLLFFVVKDTGKDVGLAATIMDIH